MSTYTNFTEVNVATALVTPSLTGTTFSATTANVTYANLGGALVVGSASTAWTNTDANFQTLVGTVANIIKVIKGISVA